MGRRVVEGVIRFKNCVLLIENRGFFGIVMLSFYLFGLRGKKDGIGYERSIVEWLEKGYWRMV